jgi:general secretion pathway protein J
MMRTLDPWPGAAHRRGFTLIEVLVALVILGVVATLAYRATAAMTDGEARLVAESERWRTLDGMFARLEGDLRQAVPRASRRGAATEPAWSALAADSAGNTALVFTRAGAEFAVEPGIAGQRIGYRLRDGTLEIVYWPQLDNVPGAEPTSYALARDIAGFRVRALAANGVWSPHWPILGEAAVPKAVRVEVDLADGTTVERWLALR